MEIKSLPRKISQKFIRGFKSLLIYIAAVGVGIFLLFFVITCTWIGYEAKQTCQEAERQYDVPAKGTAGCVEALSLLLNDDKNGYRRRNSAIWALGQFGDKRALPVLQKYYTGIIPDREPLDKMISQYELRKAIKLANGGFNMTAIFWRP